MPIPAAAVDDSRVSAFVPPAEAQPSLRAFWEVYDGARDAISAELLKECEKIPDFALLLRSMTPEQQKAQEAANRPLQEAALVRGEWGPLLDDLDKQGRTYAQMGIDFSAWFRLIAAFRTHLRRYLVDLARKNPEKAQAAGDGLHLYVDVTMSRLGQAYLTAKETIIRRQQDAIRELSTPVLQLRERLLIIPVVGLVDTQRARHLTESMLRAVRDKRARAIVMDITGVPVVDSRVANHLVLACEAARLMGAHVILTGISAEIAQALVTLGADLKGVPTLTDLQSGLEAAEAVLANPSALPAAHGNGYRAGNGVARANGRGA